MSGARRACVVGWPVAHSRSPLIHGTWLAEHGIDGAYERREVPPEDFDRFINSLSDSGYVGCNVTVPHKLAARRLVTRCDAAAEALGAVNTVWLEAGEPVGANTDVAGFLGNLDEGVPGWDRDLGRAVVLGAGGAARAVVHGLLQRGAGEITLTNRSLDRARELAKGFGPRVEPVDWSDRDAALGDAALLVNATSLGMKGSPPLDISLGALPGDAVVTDLVYVPLETELLRAARARGNPAVDGLGMLLHQAVPGFERWFGVRPQVTEELRELVIADIEAW